MRLIQVKACLPVAVWNVALPVWAETLKNQYIHCVYIYIYMCIHIQTVVDTYARSLHAVIIVWLQLSWWCNEHVPHGWSVNHSEQAHGLYIAQYKLRLSYFNPAYTIELLINYSFTILKICEGTLLCSMASSPWDFTPWYTCVRSYVAWHSVLVTSLPGTPVYVLM